MHEADVSFGVVCDRGTVLRERGEKSIQQIEGFHPIEVGGGVKQRGERGVLLWNYLILYRAGKLSTLCTSPIAICFF